MEVRVPNILSTVSSRMGRCLTNPPRGLYQPYFMLSKGVRMIWKRIRWWRGSLCARRRHRRRPGGRTQEDQKKAIGEGWERIGSTEVLLCLLGVWGGILGLEGGGGEAFWVLSMNQIAFSANYVWGNNCCVFPLNIIGREPNCFLGQLSKESNWGRMRKDQQKWGWKRGGGREDTGVVSLSCNWPGMSSCPLFATLFPKR